MKIPECPPSLENLLDPEAATDEQRGRLNRVIRLLPTETGKDRGSEYLHWERLKYKPLPEGVESHEDWWTITKFRRMSLYRQLPLLAKDGKPFQYWLPDPSQQRLHLVDQQAGGRIEISEQVTNPNSRDRYLVNSLIEEAITSSQLEGASTTHKVAKAMLREGRKPRDKSEQMIFNNYRAMSFIREEAASSLTPELIFELHRIVTADTLHDSSAEGRLRKPGEEIVVYDSRDNTLLHSPPPAEELNERLKTLCEFANRSSHTEEFLHPVVRSIILHFMIGYDHPFVDGNGRTARALFYWSMAHHGYWLMEYVSISTILKSGPSKYARAY
ncbi:MAG: Fic family protein, partial [Anaerobacillus sp.]